MELARDCMKHSIRFLKLNFTCIILLQVVKLILVQENHRALLNFDGNVIRNESRASSSDGDVFVKYNNQESQIYDRKLNNEFIVSLSSWYSYDIKQMEATKTEILNIITNRRTNELDKSAQAAAMSDGGEVLEWDGPAEQPPTQTVKPIMITTSLINYNELLQFSNLKNVVKLAILLNLNLTCILTNLLIVSFIILRNAESKSSSLSSKNRSFRAYMNLNLNMNIFLFLLLLVINLVYLVILNKYNHHASFDTFKWIKGLISMNTTETESSVVKDLHAQFETSQMSSAFNWFMQFVLISNAKINVFFMIVSICLLFTYGYLIKLDCNTDEPKQNDAEKPMLCEKEGETVDPRLRVIELKQKKLERIASIDLQWIMHSLLVIYLLSVWDIAEVYQFMQDKNVQSQSNLESFLANNAGTSLLSGKDGAMLNCKTNNNLIVLNKLNYDYINMQLVDLMSAGPAGGDSTSSDLNEALALAKEKNVDVNKSSFILNKLNKYYYNFNSNRYHHSVDFQNQLEYDNQHSKINANNGTITNHQKLTSVTKIKILFILKKNTQLFGDIFIINFSFIVLFKLRVLNKLNKFYGNLQYLKTWREQTLI